MLLLRTVHFTFQQHSVHTQVRDVYKRQLYDNGIGKKIIMYGEAWNMPTACNEGTVMAVSYTHLDVYKRQGQVWKCLKIPMMTA